MKTDRKELETHETIKTWNNQLEQEEAHGRVY